MSSTQIQWDSNGLSEAYQQVSSLRSTLQTQTDAYCQYCRQFSAAINWVNNTNGCGIEITPLDQRLKQQDAQMNSLGSLVSLAMDNADEANNSLSSDLERFKLTIGAMLLGGSTIEAIGYTALAAGAAAIGVVFGLMRGIPFANLGKIVEQVRKKAEGFEEESATTTKELDWTNSGVTTSYNYGEADLWRIEAYMSDKNYNRDIWGGIDSSQGCAVASTATALSGLGIMATPYEIYSKVNENSVSMNWSKVQTTYHLTMEMTTGGEIKNLSSEEQTARIDAALQKYLENPDTYTPPIISFMKPYQHKVVVTGKNADGTYKIIDSSGRHITTYQLVSSGYQINDSSKTFKANLTQITQYHK